MASITVRNVPDDVHRALRVRAAQHGRSAEAEIRDILERAVKPATRVRLGDALAALGRKVGLTDEDVAIIDQTRDTSPAEPTILSERPSQGTGTPMDLSRACARPARTFRPSRYVLTSVSGRFNTLHPSRQYSSICASVSADPRAGLPCAPQASAIRRTAALNVGCSSWR